MTLAKVELAEDEGVEGGFVGEAGDEGEGEAEDWGILSSRIEPNRVRSNRIEMLVMEVEDDFGGVGEVVRGGEKMGGDFEDEGGMRSRV